MPLSTFFILPVGTWAVQRKSETGGWRCPSCLAFFDVRFGLSREGSGGLLHPPTQFQRQNLRV